MLSESDRNWQRGWFEASGFEVAAFDPSDVETDFDRHNQHTASTQAAWKFRWLVTGTFIG